MARALEELHIEGPGHNTAFLSAVMDQERFASGALSTNYIKDEFPAGFSGLPAASWQEDAILAAAVAMHRIQTRRARGAAANGFSARAERSDWVVVAGGRRREVAVVADGQGLALDLTSEGRMLRVDEIRWRPGSPLFSARLDGRDFTATVAPAAEGFDIRLRAARQRALVMTPLSADLHQRLPVKTPPDTSRLVLSPMPGLVVSVDVVQGEEVKEGQVICVIEAMKMQNIIRAEREGVLKSLGAKAGESVAADDVLAEFA
jgi:propionyl-CoA carboxylase alpha chain